MDYVHDLTTYLSLCTANYIVLLYKVLGSESSLVEDMDEYSKVLDKMVVSDDVVKEFMRENETMSVCDDSILSSQENINKFLYESIGYNDDECLHEKGEFEKF